MNDRICYMEYRFTRKEFLINIAIMVFGILVVAKLFYGNFVVGVFFSPGLILLVKARKRSLLKNKRKEFKRQFKDAILAIADMMTIGYSVENAFRESYKEMSILHGNDSMISHELREIGKRVEMNIPIENAIEELARRTDIYEVRLFSGIFNIAKRTGGNMVTVIKNIAENISQSLLIEEEINVAINEKKLEFEIMSVVPLGLIIYMTVTSPGYMDVMYGTVFGRLVMTGCLFIYGAACMWGYKMCNNLQAD